MKILIGCSHSLVEMGAFAAFEHAVWSCDLLPSDSPLHLQCDIKEAIQQHTWDAIGLHPPCTALALCGNRWYGEGMPKHQQRLDALDWTEDLWKMACKSARFVYLEQPKGVLRNRLGKRHQAIHPWQFGHPEQKETWLWLQNLPLLKPDNIVYDEMMKLPKKERERIFYTPPGPMRGLERSRVFEGIVTAMAAQWQTQFEAAVKTI